MIVISDIYLCCCYCYCFFTLWWSPEAIDSLTEPVGTVDVLYQFPIQSKHYKHVPDGWLLCCYWYGKIPKYLFPTLVWIFSLLEILFGRPNDLYCIESSPCWIGMSVWLIHTHLRYVAVFFCLHAIKYGFRHFQYCCCCCYYFFPFWRYADAIDGLMQPVGNNDWMYPLSKSIKIVQACS